MLVLVGLGFSIPICSAWAQENGMSMEIRGGFRYITSNGIPDHEPGRFPNSGNPNAIRAQVYAYRVPVQPEMLHEATSVPPRVFGVAVNGVPFDPGTAEFWNGDPRSGWNYDALSGHINLGLDGSNAHVQPNGAYHYHGIPHGLLRSLAREGRMTLLGYAADGFPIYGPLGYADPLDPASGTRELRSSYRLREGERPGGLGGPGGAYDGTFVQDFHYVAGAGDLDECNGRYGVTEDFPEGTYYYVLTAKFPFVPRCWRGQPDDSFRRKGPGIGGGMPPHLRGQRRGGIPGGAPPPMYHDGGGAISDSSALRTK
jgi:hypothetical protein